MRSGDWDGCCQQLKTFSFGRLGALRGFEDDVLKRRIQSGRDQIKKIVKGLSQRQFCANAQEFKEDIADLKPKVATLFSLVLSYDQAICPAEKRAEAFGFF